MAARKRKLMEPTPGDKRFVRRDSEGKFKDVVDVGRSLAADRRSKSKTAAKPGQGDKGDVKRSSSAKKSSARKSSAKSPAKASSKKSSSTKSSSRKTATKKSSSKSRSSKKSAKKK